MLKTKRSVARCEELKKFRERMSWNQADLAKMLSATQEYISMVESHKRRPGKRLAYGIQVLMQEHEALTGMKPIEAEEWGL